MTTRSKERTNFLADILIGAVEDGGLNGWRQVSNYNYELADPDDILSGTIDASVMVWEDEHEDGRYAKSHAVTLDTIATGLGRIERGDKGCECNDEITEIVKDAQKSNDAGDCDSYIADAIMQAGIFGEVIYG